MKKSVSPIYIVFAVVVLVAVLAFIYLKVAGADKGSDVNATVNELTKNNRAAPVPEGGVVPGVVAPTKLK
jgi:hypothetical protein